jgi:hypothetical protein
LPTPDEYRALLRRDLVSFAQLCFSELNPRTRFAMSWHIEIIAAKLTALRSGKIRRLIINMSHFIDFVIFIFHPASFQEAHCVSRRRLGGMNQEGAAMNFGV